LHVHFINLDRSPERLVEFKRVNGHLTQTSRFPAVDGQRIDIGALAAQGIVSEDILSSFRIGAVGVALSNIALWELAIKSQTPVTFAEDDAIFNHHFDRCAEQLIASLPPDWDVIVWGFNFDLFLSFEMLPGVSLCLAQFDQDRMRANVRAFQEQRISPRAYPLRWAFGTPCYSVSPKGALALKTKCLPLRPKLIPCPEGARAPPNCSLFRNVGIDNTLNSVYGELKAFVCFPPLVVVKNEAGQSTIQARDPVAEYGHLIRRMPDTPRPGDDTTFRVICERALERHRQGRLEEALAAYDEALARRPGDADVLINRGSVLLDAGRYDDALAAFDGALATKPDDFATLNMRGLALERLLRLEEALASYEEAIAARSDSTEALYNRANVLADLRRFDEALNDYAVVLASRPDFLPALYNRALILDQLGRFQEALASYTNVLAINPDHAGARENHRALSEQLAAATHHGVAS
jgi:glycosyl transferase family 25